MQALSSWVDSHRKSTVAIALFIAVALVAGLFIARQARWQSEQDAQAARNDAAAQVPTADRSGDEPVGGYEADLPDEIPVDPAARNRVQQARVDAAAGFTKDQMRRAQLAALSMSRYLSQENQEQRLTRLAQYFTADADGIATDTPVLRSTRYLGQVGAVEETSSAIGAAGSGFVSVSDKLGTGVPYAEVLVPIDWQAQITLDGAEPLTYMGSASWTVWVPYYGSDGDKAVAVTEPDRGSIGL
ncbi:hypothetical protein F8O07_06795 [Pseudoclavibacter sp. CFCC 13796]|uniref:hypothetical protein n=1 Tax=Pseudoclavibacter sp. CFCC 13796 TaxID=2615179 RepID=UPI00130164B7|nr:hypothetical protein [Pseudoclavibacter sp. CFCC 13796]KAB1661606.1 hypothetical protein F8O07_06795 [Pseudoclavibacter sp. CFCC 13796]